MVVSSRNRVLLAVVSLLLPILTACALEISANPYAPPPPASTFVRLTDPVSGIAWLFLVNVLVNLFCYSALLLVLVKRQDVPEIIDTTAARFLLAFSSAVVLITLVGATVDYYLLTQPRHITFQTGLGPMTGVYRVIVFNAVNWMLALCIIFLSILVVSLVILRLRTWMTLKIAVGFVFINLVVWILIDTFGEDTTFLTIIFGVMAAPFVVRAVLQWYATRRRIPNQPLHISP